MTVKIKMLRSIPGSDDGILTQLYSKGIVYEVGEKLANSFIKAEYAEKINSDDVVEQIKAIPVIPENKSFVPEEENKEEAEEVVSKGFGKFNKNKKDK